MFRESNLGGLLCLIIAVGCSGSDDTDAVGAERQTQGVEQGLVVGDPCAAVRCAGGTHCEAQGNTATCEPNVFCGGIAAFPCPGAGQCMDDPNDACDPVNGGADCGGMCECSGVLVLCAEGTAFDESPQVCSCVEQTPSDPCATVRCAAGTTCHVDGDQAQCVADVRCGGITGEGCPGAGDCVDDPSDDCDPERGGADCGGMCQCSGALVLCAPNTVFDDSPDICACEPTAAVGCEAVLCLTGTRCVERNGQVQCVPNRHRPPRKPWGQRRHRGHGKHQR